MCSLFSGDLLFVRPTNEGLDQSIASSTKRDAKVTYSHVALVDARKAAPAGDLKDGKSAAGALKASVSNAAGPLVIEATGDDGVVARPLSEFMNDNAGRVDVYRYNGVFDNLDAVLDRALNQVGKPYNHGFYQAGPGFYCSQLVTYAFEKEGLFEETPLRFGPNGTVLPEWVDYYAELGRPVPEKELGSSPNSLLEGGAWARVDCF